MPQPKSTDFSPLWLVDWSDEEDADFRWAWESGKLSVRVLRSRPTGPTVGQPRHRLHSWPAYAGLAARGLAASRGGPLVAWQPIAGALAALVRRGSRPPLTLLNPILHGARSAPQRMMLRGAARADRVIFFSRRAVDQAVGLGLDPRRTMFVPLGVRANPSPGPDPAGGHLLAVGRDERDWPTLARASAGLELEVRAVGAPPDLDLGPIRRMPQVTQGGLRAMMADATAVVVPLPRPDRTAGQLTVLLAMSVGRAVVATRTQGTEDYVTPESGFLVPPGDVGALRRAMVDVADPDAARQLGRGALGLAQGSFSLERFVARVDAAVPRNGS